MNNSIAGQVVLVTGGARGMGAEHCRGVVAAGARAVVADVLDADGDALAVELGSAAAFVHLDVTDEQQWQEAVAFAEVRFGPVNHLVNNAGIVTFGPIEQLSTADWQRTLDVNLTGAWLGMRATVPSIRRAGGGSIVNISSTAGLQGYPHLGAYVASKWGLRGLTKTAALELAPDGIRVNSVHPGPVRTPMTDGIGGDVSFDAPIPRFGEPQEVTALVMYLLADATFSTGHEFVVDGGITVGRNIAVTRDATRSEG